MADMRTLLKGMNLPKTIPVGTADAGSKITSTLSAGADYIMANVSVCRARAVRRTLLTPFMLCCVSGAPMVWRRSGGSISGLDMGLVSCLATVARFTIGRSAHHGCCDVICLYSCSFQTNDVSATEAASNKPAAYIAETGWPTGANDTANMQYQAAVAGVDQLNTFLDTFVCAANRESSFVCHE